MCMFKISFFDTRNSVNILTAAENLHRFWDKMRESSRSQNTHRNIDAADLGVVSKMNTSKGAAALLIIAIIALLLLVYLGGFLWS